MTAERFFEAVANGLPDPVLLCTDDGTVQARNAAAARLLPHLPVGASLSACAGNSAGSAAAAGAILDGARLIQDQLRRWLASGDPLPGRLVIKNADGDTVQLRCHGARASGWPGPPAAVIAISRLGAPDAFGALTRQVRDLHDEVAYRRRVQAERDRALAVARDATDRLRALYRIADALSGCTTVTEVSRVVEDIAATALGVAEVRMQLSDEPEQPATPTRVALTLIARPGHEAPEPDLVATIAQQIGDALHRAGRYDREHRIAERLQHSLLPRPASLPALAIATRYRPATDLMNVGGDWYDSYLLDDAHIGLSIGDVAGHGLTAAAAMAQLAAALRGIVLRSGLEPDAVLAELNDFLFRYHRDAMATACYLVYSPRTGELSYSQAGHPPALLVGTSGPGRYLDRALGPPLGVEQQTRYRAARAELRPDDTLVLYTDGLIERRTEDLAVGLRRLAEAAQRGRHHNLEDMSDAVLHHRADNDFFDDCALLLARPQHVPLTRRSTAAAARETGVRTPRGEVG